MKGMQVDDMMETNAMMVECDGPNDIYRGLLNDLVERGDDHSSRGLGVKKVGPATVIFLDPRERFLTCPGRFIHPYFQVLESIWILGGHGDLEFISHYLKNMENYADNREEFHAPYGTRMRYWNDHRDVGDHVWKCVDQFENCYNYLREEPDTRHAVMTFWNPSFDHCYIETNDRPCNITFQFLIDNGKLDLYIFNRSNDINWGLMNTNVVQFSVILEVMALLLGIPVGKQIHMITNLHVYDFQGDITQRVLNRNYFFNIYKHVRPTEFEADYKPGEELSTVDLGHDLELFFEKEKAIRTGEPERHVPDPSLNYLRYALDMAKSWKAYKDGDVRRAMDILSRNQDGFHDIYVSCMEYLNRDAPGELISYAYNSVMHKGINFAEVAKYIEDH